MNGWSRLFPPLSRDVGILLTQIHQSSAGRKEHRKRCTCSLMDALWTWNIWQTFRTEREGPNYVEKMCCSRGSALIRLPVRGPHESVRVCDSCSGRRAGEQR